MSSFKRNVSAKLGLIQSCPIGFHPSLYNGHPTASTGIASLDDVIGGGIPISSSFIIDEDADSSYARLILRYWIAQGISSGQDVIVVGSSLDENGNPKEIVEHLMSPVQDYENDAPVNEKSQKTSSNSKDPGTNATDSEDEDKSKSRENQRMKIAWRYENMGKHLAEAEPSHLKARCFQFDLSKTMRFSVEQSSRIHCIDTADFYSYQDVLSAINDLTSEISRKKSLGKISSSFRIAIQSFASPAWPSGGQQVIHRFLLGLKQILQSTAAVATLTFPSLHHPAQLKRILPWVVDGYMTIESFAGSEASQAAFPNHQGAVNFIRLPSAASLLPPATKLSALRGLGGTTSGARIDSNLGFKLGRRKGFRIEMMGLGLELDSQSAPEVPLQSTGKDEVNPELPSIKKPSPKSKEVKKRPKVRFGEPSSDPSSNSPAARDLGNIDW